MLPLNLFILQVLQVEKTRYAIISVYFHFIASFSTTSSYSLRNEMEEKVCSTVGLLNYFWLLHMHASSQLWEISAWEILYVLFVTHLIMK